jgi:arsenate reductase (glutaredoxin)
MAEHPILIERPVVRTGKGTRLCRPAERVEDIL